jgi:N-acetyl-anhydromuramyl-L-alanine amidase AmpD
MDQLPSSPPARPSPPAIVAVPAGSVLVKLRTAHPSNYSRRLRPRTQAIALHATDGHEGTRKDDDVAAMFAGPLAKPRSCTWVVDADSITRCVPPVMTAWHCGHTGNARCEGVELCGLAKQSRAEWFDEMSLRTLCIAARLVAMRCTEYEIDPVFVNAEQLRNGYRGITTHAEISLAWHESDHDDPGPHFPMDEFIAAVRAAL